MVRFTARTQGEKTMVRGEASVASFRSDSKVMEVKDWDELYQKIAKGKVGKGPITRNMF